MDNQQTSDHEQLGQGGGSQASENPGAIGETGRRRDDPRGPGTTGDEGGGGISAGGIEDVEEKKEEKKLS